MKQKVVMFLIAMLFVFSFVMPKQASAAPLAQTSRQVWVYRSCSNGVALAVHGAWAITIKPYYAYASGKAITYPFGGGMSKTFTYSSSTYMFSVSGNVWSAVATCR